MQPESTLSDKLAIISPNRIFDDSVGAQVLQVEINNEWIEVEETVFRSWTGFRRINGDDYHGPVYGFESPRDSSPFDGKRACGCSVCQAHVAPKLKVN